MRTMLLLIGFLTVVFMIRCYLPSMPYNAMEAQEYFHLTTEKRGYEIIESGFLIGHKTFGFLLPIVWTYPYKNMEDVIAKRDSLEKKSIPRKNRDFVICFKVKPKEGIRAKYRPIKYNPFYRDSAVGFYQERIDIEIISFEKL